MPRDAALAPLPPRRIERRGRALGANALLFLEAARWAQELGYKRFHLGGGVGGASDSLFDFESFRFDPGGELEMAVGKAIHDDDAYRRLSGDAPADGFSPATAVPCRVILKALFWASPAGLVWTHAGYPLAAAAARARCGRGRCARATSRRGDLIVPAHDEEDGDRARLENLLELDYPAEQLEIVVASDASTDGTDEIVDEIASATPRVRLLALPARREARGA